MILKQNLLVFLLFVLISTLSFSQSKPAIAQVDKKIDVVRVYEQVVREGYGTPFIYERLASAYYFKGEYGKAVAWFQKFYSEEKNTDIELAYQYKQALKAVAFSASANIENEVLLK